MTKTLSTLRKKIDEKPLFYILIIALVPRLLAAIFAKGYGMHDDAFGPVQTMQEALDNFSVITANEPKLILYPLVQYITFAFCEFFGIFDPQLKMYAVRFIHAIYSLLTVYFSYKITISISTQKNAITVGIIIALLWFIPYMSVRNLVEMVSIPCLLAAVYYFLKSTNIHKENSEQEIAPTSAVNSTLLSLSGLLFALAFAIRFQTAFIPFGMGLYLLFKRKFKILTILTVSTFLGIILFLGIPEYLLWGQPFQNLINYVTYNATAYNNYPTSPWYMVPTLIIGVLLPPMGIMLFYGFFKTWKKYPLLFIAALCFIVFHSIYPNKQERFILTVMPLVVILAVIGWNNFVEKSKFWIQHNKLLNGLWKSFWIINSILLLLFTFTYSKRTRVESFSYLSKKDLNSIVIEMNETNRYFAPIFYLGKNRTKPIYYLYKDYKPQEFISDFSKFTNTSANYIIFFDEQNIQTRIENFNNNFNCELEPQTEISPGLMDKILHFTNPKHNRNYKAYIFKIKKV